MESAYHPRQAPLWYGAAAMIGESRLKLHAHEPDEVLAGAALGYLTSRWELAQPHGLILRPWVEPRESTGGLLFRKSF